MLYALILTLCINAPVPRCDDYVLDYRLSADDCIARMNDFPYALAITCRDDDDTRRRRRPRA